MTDGEREIMQEIEADFRPSELEALQISYDTLSDRYDAALDRNVALVAENNELRASLAQAIDHGSVGWRNLEKARGEMIQLRSACEALLQANQAQRDAEDAIIKSDDSHSHMKAFEAYEDAIATTIIREHELRSALQARAGVGGVTTTRND